MPITETKRVNTAVSGLGSFDHACRECWWRPTWVLCRCTYPDRNECRRRRRMRRVPPGSRRATHWSGSSESGRQRQRTVQPERSCVRRCCRTHPTRIRCLPSCRYTLQSKNYTMLDEVMQKFSYLLFWVTVYKIIKMCGLMVDPIRTLSIVSRWHLSATISWPWCLTAVKLTKFMLFRLFLSLVQWLTDTHTGR